MALNNINRATGKTYLTELAETIALNGGLTRNELDMYIGNCAGEEDKLIRDKLVRIIDNTAEVQLISMAALIESHVKRHPTNTLAIDRQVLDLVDYIRERHKRELATSERRAPVIRLLVELPDPIASALDVDGIEHPREELPVPSPQRRFFHSRDDRRVPKASELLEHLDDPVVLPIQEENDDEELNTPEVLVARAETVEAENAGLLNAIVEYRNFNATVGVAVLSNPVWVLLNGLEDRNLFAIVDRIVNDDEALLQSWITTQVDRLTRKFELDREWLDSYIEDFERVEVVHGVHNHHRPEYIANVTVQWPLNRNLDDQRPVGEVINVCNARNRHFLEHLNRLKESLEYNVRLKDTVEGRKANYTEMMFLLRDLLQHEYTEERMEVTKQQMEEARKLFTTKMEIGEQLRASIKEAKALGVPSSKYGEEIEIEGLDRQEVRETVRDRIANARTVAELTERDGALDTLHAFNAIRNVYYKTVPTVSNTAEASHLDDAECLHVVHHAQDAPSILNVTTVNPVALAARLDVMRNR